MNDTDQYRTLPPKRLPDATMFALPGGRWIAAQYNEEFGWWEVVEFGHLWSVLHDYGLTRIEAELLAHGVRLLKLIELEA